MSAGTHNGRPIALNSVAAVAAQRARLWDGGFRPVPIYNADSTRTHSPGKAPMGDDWGNQARRDPPAAADSPPHLDALNTGILCDGLRAIDVDVDNPTIAASIRSKALARFGEAPLRYRRDSPRCLLLYRAAEGTPSKRAIAGTFGKVEILGRGQQFVAFGQHPSGGTLEWMPEAPGDTTLDSLPVVTEDQITAFLAECAPSLGAKPEQRQTDRTHTSSRHGLRADSLQVLTALHSIPNNGVADWEEWNRVGMALWAAFGGSQAGRSAFHGWSEQNDTYDATETDRRWDHYAVSPPSNIGAGTLFHMARQAPQAEPEQPDSAPDINPDTYPLPVKFFNEINASLDAADFVEGILIDASMSVIYGQSNSGKTFFASDLALHIAAQMVWNGREVERGGVLWLAMEGAHGISNRIAAWREHHGVDVADLPFAIVPVALNLLDPNADTSALIETIRAVKVRLGIAIRWTVVDTLSRAMAGGNENAPDDMGALVTNGTRIQQETKSALCWIHHSGKDDAKGARGHSLLRAATDTEIEITADGPNRTARVTKQRELECSGEFRFTLEVVKLGDNRRGKPVTSCVVKYADGASDTAGAVPRTRHLTGHNKRALEVLTDLVATSGQAGHAGAPSGVPSVPARWWRERFYERAMPGEDQATKQKAFRRASLELINQHIAGMGGDRVWIATWNREQDEN